jgi:hypothetical protein
VVPSQEEMRDVRLEMRDAGARIGVDPDPPRLAKRIHHSIRQRLDRDHAPDSPGSIA